MSGRVGIGSGGGQYFGPKINKESNPQASNLVSSNKNEAAPAVKNSDFAKEFARLINARGARYSGGGTPS